MLQDKRARKLLSLVEAKGFGEDISSLPIRRNIDQFDFIGKDTLADKVVVHLNVLGSGMEDGFLCKLDVVEVVAVDRRQNGDLHMQILQEPLEPYGFACCNNCSSIFGRRAGQCNCQLLLAPPGYRSAPK